MAPRGSLAHHSFVYKAVRGIERRQCIKSKEGTVIIKGSHVRRRDAIPCGRIRFGERLVFFLFVHESPFLLRILALQPITIGVQKHDLAKRLTHFRLDLADFVEDFFAVIAEDENTALQSVGAEYGRGKLDRWMGRLFNLIVYNIQFKWRYENLLTVQVKGPHEERALRSVLKLIHWVDFWRAMVVIHPGDFHATFIQQANFKVVRFPAAPAQEFQFNRGTSSAVRTRQVIQNGRVFGENEQIGNCRLEVRTHPLLSETHDFRFLSFDL
jgi:hypothetical protein